MGGVVWRIHGHTPFGELEKSLLRKALSRSLECGFPRADRERDERYTGMLDPWSTWLRSCECEGFVGDGDPDCDVHAVTRACDSYMHIVTTEWDLIVDFYLTPALSRDPHVGPHVDLRGRRVRAARPRQIRGRYDDFRVGHSVAVLAIHLLTPIITFPILLENR